MLDETTLTQPAVDDNARILKYLRSVIELGSLTQEDTLRFLGHPSAEVRYEAVRACRSFDPALTAIVGRAFLGESAPLLRMCGAELVGECGNQELDTDRLVMALMDQSWIVRSSAALALGCLGGEFALQSLAARLESDPNEAVRRDIGHAIAEFGTASVAYLESALRSEKSRIARCGLLNGYYNVTGEGLMHLMSLLTDTDVMVRSNAINCWIWEEIKPADTQKVVAALTMLIGTDENPVNVADAKFRLDELAWKQKAEATQTAEAAQTAEIAETVGSIGITEISQVVETLEQADIPIDEAA